jgi:hypothetical protein
VVQVVLNHLLHLKLLRVRRHQTATWLLLGA